jgi:apolipoprotein N-acyltransferase
MPSAGFAAAKGELNLVAVVLAGSIGSMLGALVFYYLGLFLGTNRLVTLANKYGRWLTVSGKDIQRANTWFDKYGYTVVFFCRFIPGIRSLVSLPAGVAAMKILPFLLLTLIGNIIWNFLLTYAGYLLGDHYVLVDRYIGDWGKYVLAALAVWYLIRLIQQMREQPETTEMASPLSTSTQHFKQPTPHAWTPQQSTAFVVDISYDRQGDLSPTKNEVVKVSSQSPAPQRGRNIVLQRQYHWLALGICLSLFATTGRWDFPLVAWLYPLFLLRFTRASKPIIGFGWTCLASTIAMCFFLYQSQLLESPLIIIAALIMGTALAIPYLLDRLISTQLKQISEISVTLIFPLSRVVIEYLLAQILPFGNVFSLAYTQFGNLPLLQLISITGIYGVSFLIAWFASTATWIWEQNFSWSRIQRTTLLYSGILGLVLLSGNIQLAFFPPSSPTIRIAGVSPEYAIRQKATRVELANFMKKKQITAADFVPLRSSFAAVNETLLIQSQHEADAGTKIVVWPEGAALTLSDDVSSLIERSKTLARQKKIYLQIAYVVFQYQSPDLRVTQGRAVMFDPQGNIVWIYDKAHPIPGMEDYPAGDGEVPVVNTPYGRIGNVICFDGFFPDLMRQAGSKGVDLMLVPSNDWRGIDPWATQHITFRAIENGYSLVRYTSNGRAMAVDYQGHILAAVDYFTTDKQTMIVSVPTRGVSTIYALIGDLFSWLCIGGLLLLTGRGVLASLTRCTQAQAS